jgi:hypothetical protein
MNMPDDIAHAKRWIAAIDKAVATGKPYARNQLRLFGLWVVGMIEERYRAERIAYDKARQSLLPDALKNWRDDTNRKRGGAITAMKAKKVRTEIRRAYKATMKKSGTDAKREHLIAATRERLVRDGTAVCKRTIEGATTDL